jgi:hypothetical protein
LTNPITALPYLFIGFVLALAVRFTSPYRKDFGPSQAPMSLWIWLAWIFFWPVVIVLVVVVLGYDYVQPYLWRLWRWLDRVKI